MKQICHKEGAQKDIASISSARNTQGTHGQGTHTVKDVTCNLQNRKQRSTRVLWQWCCNQLLFALHTLYRCPQALISKMIHTGFVTKSSFTVHQQL